ncbi:His Kinase A (phospho-acceptor) domain-containing protein [Butyrivibrio sp. ob235]|uniref:response regulator n=1 Tax=Butyrivibrio sp. ob235 TaxID=1761780 RepID=UPI0008B7171A|nr:response regulator [Butyrivibrio sp. ob235]SEL18820.1 His Kinase A (phospho-acceptor) domain-containing protein [Butyrivibrio sp. ob235]
MKLHSKSGLTRVAIIGGIIVVAIMIIGTLWMGQSASKDTESAVKTVSLLYLDELAGRREQVVASTLSNYVSDLDTAIGLIEKTDLESVESLQAYQFRMKQLYKLEKFAFVDEEGIIYTSRGTRTDIDLYSFNHKTLSEPEISIKNADGNNKKIIIAVPIDRLKLEKHTLIVCFMEMDINNFLDKVSLQANDSSATFCNLYAADGSSLTGAVLGGLAADKNILTALESAKFDEGYSIEEMRRCFAEDTEGIASFTYNGVKETIAFVPVRGTDWVLTYLIRESVITEQINTISQGIIIRSLIQSILTAAVMIALLVIMITQTKKTAKLAAEQESSEILQQELEERIALQDELIAQEKVRTQQDKMINALASDYRSVYYVDLENNNAICYRGDENHEDDICEGDRFNFSEKFTEYAESFVAEEYRQGFIDFIKPENIKQALEKEPIIAYRYLVKKNGEETYEMLRMAGVGHPGDAQDNKIHAVGAGFSDIDAQMRDSLAKSQALSDALKTAEKASRAKTIFLSNMSHEIRTPMNAIIGLDSLALHEPDISDATKDYLEKIGSSAQHLLSLINDILDMSRIESGKMVLRNEEFAFSKLLEQINTIFNGQCMEKGLEYKCNIIGELNDYYIGDSTKLRQVLINILGNAVKFTPEGGAVTLDVEKAAGYGGNSTLRFRIKDTGIGMSKEFLPSLFETFSQEDTTAANKYGSSGLGMAITKSIVEMMNGKIEVQSEKGKGSIFTVTVTLLDSDKKHSEDNSDIEINPKEMCVLVIDDDPVALDHAKLVLGNEGIAVETVRSGQEAIDLVKVHKGRMEPYNLIIVDWKMPEMDGLETTRQIREIIGDDSAIIMLTAYSWDEIHGEATDAGVDSFISKPLFPGSLLDEFRNALKKKRLQIMEKPKKADLTGRRILLAEDVNVNAQIMIKVLKMKEMETELAVNGKIAVEMFESHPENYYDAILMDMRMPEMNGLEATAAIRAMGRADSKSIPIIALTANAFDEDVQQSLQAGLNAHLSKPVQPEVLFDTLSEFIK